MDRTDDWPVDKTSFRNSHIEPFIILIVFLSSLSSTRGPYWNVESVYIQSQFRTLDAVIKPLTLRQLSDVPLIGTRTRRCDTSLPLKCTTLSSCPYVVDYHDYVTHVIQFPANRLLWLARSSICADITRLPSSWPVATVKQLKVQCCSFPSKGQSLAISDAEQKPCSTVRGGKLHCTHCPLKHSTRSIALEHNPLDWLGRPFDHFCSSHTAPIWPTIDSWSIASFQRLRYCVNFFAFHTSLVSTSEKNRQTNFQQNIVVHMTSLLTFDSAKFTLRGWCYNIASCPTILGSPLKCQTINPFLTTLLLDLKTNVCLMPDPLISHHTTMHFCKLYLKSTYRFLGSHSLLAPVFQAIRHPCIVLTCSILTAIRLSHTPYSQWTSPSEHLSSRMELAGISFRIEHWLLLIGFPTMQLWISPAVFFLFHTNQDQGIWKTRSRQSSVAGTNIAIQQEPNNFTLALYLLMLFHLPSYTAKEKNVLQRR